MRFFWLLALLLIMTSCNSIWIAEGYSSEEIIQETLSANLSVYKEKQSIPRKFWKYMAHYGDEKRFYANSGEEITHFDLIGDEPYKRITLIGESEDGLNGFVLYESRGQSICKFFKISKRRYSVVSASFQKVISNWEDMVKTIDKNDYSISRRW